MFQRMQHQVRWAILAVCMVVSMGLQAGPLETLQTATQQILGSIEKNRPQLKKEPQYINVLVDQHLSPYLDFEEMAKWVVGRNAWQHASAGEQATFTHAFRKLVIQTYASSLNNYNHQEIVYFPLREPVENKTRVQVQSEIRQEGKTPLQVAYRLVEHDNTWRVYDILIEGVSLLKGFQAQFADTAHQKGLGAVTQKVLAHLAKTNPGNNNSDAQ